MNHLGLNPKEWHGLKNERRKISRSRPRKTEPVSVYLKPLDERLEEIRARRAFTSPEIRFGQGLKPIAPVQVEPVAVEAAASTSRIDRKVTSDRRTKAERRADNRRASDRRRAERKRAERKRAAKEGDACTP